MTKFGDLISGDVFIARSGIVYILPTFDIFHNDRVVRTSKSDRRIAVTLSGDNAGKYNGVFRNHDEVQLVKVEAAIWQD